MSIGWKNNRYTYLTLFHFSISDDGKVWLLQNNTEDLIADEVEERGVARADIVIGFVREEDRPLTGFAVS